jgi:uridine kinase
MMHTKPMVISVSAISGGGKTTVISALSSRLANSAVLSFDDYEEDAYLERDINEWSADGNDYNEWHVQAIAEDIEKLLTTEIEYILLDYPFGRCNDCVGRYIDVGIFIDTPLDMALARRTLRDYANHNSNTLRMEERLSAIVSELKFYMETSRPTYARMAEVLIPRCDLVIDGLKTPEQIVDEIVEYMNTINIQ